jgi:acetoacetate decarboxylase
MNVPVLGIVACTHLAAGLTLGRGKVVHDYLE